VTERRTRERALTGIRVLELCGSLPGPFCGQLLADLGADVVKVEWQEGGDPARNERERIAGMGASFVMANRNKRSVVLDLGQAAGREVFFRLARTADVLLEGDRPGALDRLGVGYEAIAREAPRVVYCSLTGYGQDGPYAQRPGSDINYAALSGMLDQNGARDGAPIPLALPAADLGGALFAAVSILAALRARDRSGVGQHIDVSLTDAAIALLPLQYASCWADSGAPTRGASSLTGGYPGYGVYVTRDGQYLALGAFEDRFWRRLCELLGRPDLVERRRPRDTLELEKVETAVAMAIAERTREEWVELLADDEVCAAPVLALQEALRDPHNVHRDTFTSCEGQNGQRLPQVSFPVRLSETPAAMVRPPPRLGEHTREVLSELGYTQAEILRLENAGTVAGDRPAR
jgi:crotonobetainyl-CoA:carnitine CoA-transferase CaiB-like acyl-CoA transferase